MDTKLLQEKLCQFSAERDWDIYHTPKNLAMALSVEASELVEIFQWLTEAESRAVLQADAEREHIEDEVADILLYLLRFADIASIDLAAVTARKLHKNAQKYPVATARGNALKHVSVSTGKND